ncbi:hypothetical protein [Priestia megaterium]|uniref:hypothetical protein n=1 Tax=Priestia megaterium TaxID=1404 RepID=UPI0031FC6211
MSENFISRMEDVLEKMMFEDVRYVQRNSKAYFFKGRDVNTGDRVVIKVIKTTLEVQWRYKNELVVKYQSEGELPVAVTA